MVLNTHWIILHYTSQYNLHILYSLSTLALTGEPSLQNTLEFAGRVLRPLPGHSSRELLILFASLTTCDPGDINTTIQVFTLNSSVYVIKIIFLMHVVCSPYVYLFIYIGIYLDLSTSCQPLGKEELICTIHIATNQCHYAT